MRSGRRVNIQKLVDQRVEEWARRRATQSAQTVAEEPVCRLYVAISRAVGTHGRQVAQGVAERLGWQYYEREIVEFIAERAQVREAVVKSLGETQRDEVDNWVRTMLDRDLLSEDAYVRHLVSVVTTLAAHERIVILGRGAQFILPPERGLRVRFVAPLEYRVWAAVEDYGITEDEARELIRDSDRAQERFYRSRFGRDCNAPLAYDLVINASTIERDHAVDAILCALKSKLGPEL